ncbi:cell division protein FtsQ/DivIB [Polaromonas naphthalenivorans]|uniref:Cell division protein FtsQ n=1 Tax=Polaromonas naphthalenivorans (strain CJ2) TaxID=365044 RepID=A1VST3_POLNA|nr:cell division protein FtsQ/DivIB [Polaromonas naphthalenivorans]ABM38711.1 Polypeptide-transport-associated domain protein, FtsQ-type [Polaromonas naphthalenivorans CJ2]
MPLPVPLPPDVRLMNTVSVLLCLGFAAMVLSLGMAWLVHQPAFNLSAIRVGGELTHNNAVTLRANVAPKLAGNFLTVDLEATREAFETVPWVRRAVVQREFPNRLKVVLYEHKAVAYWGPEGDARLVNNQGEVFEANPGDVETEELPLLSGPKGQAPQVLQAYQTLLPLFEEMDAVLEQLQLSELGNWRAQLDSGAVIELGHGSLAEVQARTRRFIDTVTQVASRFGRDVESADLRYGSGYALKLRGVTTGEIGDKDEKKKKR